MRLQQIIWLFLLPLFLHAESSATVTAPWKSCPIAWQGAIEPNSALDFSFLNHTPAGKYGFLKRVGDHFEFEQRPGEAVRFWGTNFAIEGPFPDKSLAPGIAKTMAAQGANMVRFHLYAARPTLLQSADGGLNPDMLDKMFFLFAELKKNGIYIYMDLNDGQCYDWLLKRKPTMEPQERLKAYSLFDPELIQSTKRLAELLFTTPNPYTGLTFAEDPAVAIYELTNEHSMLTTWQNWNAGVWGGEFLLAGEEERYRKILTERWHEFLAKQGHEPLPLPNCLNNSELGRRFGAQLDTQYFREMIAYLRSIGVKVPICGTNFYFSLAQMVPAQEGDVIGHHDYWTHPNFNRNPITFEEGGAISLPLWHGALLNSANLANSVLDGFPIVHGEWNFCYPNPYRCEAIPLAAAYAAYQDWDGMLFYGATGSCDGGIWSRFVNNPGIMIHSQQTDPATWGVSQVGAAMFRRGDVAPAARKLTITLPREDAYKFNGMPVSMMPFLPEFGRVAISFSEDGTTNELGKLLKEKNTRQERYQAFRELLNDKRSDDHKTVSDTEQIVRFSQPPLLFVNTPKTQSVTGQLSAIAQSGMALGDFKIVSPMNWGSFNAVSRDGLPLAQSTQILLTAVGNASNTGEKLEGNKIIDMGTAPVLIEPFVAEIVWRGTAPQAKVYELEPNTGKRVRELPSEHKEDGLHFKLDGSAATIYYELTTK